MSGTSHGDTNMFCCCQRNKASLFHCNSGDSKAPHVMRTLSVLTSFFRGNLLLGSLETKIFPLGAAAPTGPGAPHY